MLAGRISSRKHIWRWKNEEKNTCLCYSYHHNFSIDWWCVSGEASTKTSDMFEYIGFDSEISCRIFYDTETKVMYAVLNYKSIIPLVDENGKPKLWEE